MCFAILKPTGIAKECTSSRRFTCRDHAWQPVSDQQAQSPGSSGSSARRSETIQNGARRVSEVNDWKEVTRARTCPICDKPDWCGRSGDVVRCMRVSEPPVQWRVVKRNDDGGTVFAPIDASRANRPMGRPGIRAESGDYWENLSEQFRKCASPERLAELAKELGVTLQALLALETGWNSKRRVYTVPERDGRGRIIGIGTRAPDGRKRFMKGGKRGLIVPRDWPRQETPHLLVEGSSDLAAAWTLGLSAIGRPHAQGGVQHLAELLKDGPVLVVGENDSKPNGRSPGREGASATAQRLANEWSRPVAWTLPPSGAKDIREWLNAREMDLTDTVALRDAGGMLIRTLTDGAIDVAPQLKLRTADPYRETPDGIVHDRPSRDGPYTVCLTNFRARIVGDVAYDDGAEAIRVYEMEATLNGNVKAFRVPVGSFVSMVWPYTKLGPSAVIYPGQLRKDHARTAIQLLSGKVIEQTVYTHTGWRQHGSQWVYLHAKGAIGAQGAVSTIQTELPDSLALFVLPVPPSGTDVTRAVAATLELLDLGPDRIMVPLIGAIYRSPLGPSDFTVHLAGQTGTFKTELAALAQQHFGAEFSAKQLPASWSSTGNHLEQLAFTAKDALLVVDDFAPSGTVSDVARLQREADRLVRAQGNRSGRGRLRPDGTPRPVRPPRGLILSTGEDIPLGHSIRARMLVLETCEGDIDVDKLSEAQFNAASGLFASGMAGFLQWLASRREQVQARLRERILELRRSAPKGGRHRRTADIFANLAVGVSEFLRFALEVGAINAASHDALWARSLRALDEIVKAQEQHIINSDPAKRFIELLTSVLASGLAHVTSLSGAAPTSYATSLWGWRERPTGTPGGPPVELQARGDRIGWLDGDELLLIPAASFRAVQNMAGPGGERISVGEKTLWKRLDEAGYLAAKEGSGRRTVKRTIDTQRPRVVVLRVSALFPPDSGQSGRLGRDASERKLETRTGPHLRPDPADFDPKLETDNGALPTNDEEVP